MLGHNNIGQLGLGDKNDRGDQPGEMGAAMPAVDLGGARVVSMSSDFLFSCALLDDETVPAGSDERPAAWHHPACRVQAPQDQTEPAAQATASVRPIAGWLFPVFFLSGAAALVYQIVWQRALFAIYGVDTISMTIVVTAFMLGLGLGSLAGGVVSRRHPRAAVALFAWTELGIGLYGALSLWIFAAVAESTRGIGHAAAGVLAFLLVVFPALLMGASLPLLVGHAAPRTHNMGRAIGDLYCANTLGAACGAFLAVYFLLGALGLRATTEVTAVCNCGLGLLVLSLSRRRGAET